MDKRPAFALRQVFAGNPKLIDVGLLQDDHGRKEYFANGVGVGFDATVTIRSRHYTMLQGFSAYMAAVLQTIALDHEAPSMHIQTDQEIWDEATMLLVMCYGPREGGGFLVAPEA
jgi:diacylglycerol kinase family enzyme